MELLKRDPRPDQIRRIHDCVFCGRNETTRDRIIIEIVAEQDSVFACNECLLELYKLINLIDHYGGGYIGLDLSLLSLKEERTKILNETKEQVKNENN